jgi:hypothetical protein
MNIKLKKIDALIVVILLVVAGIVLFKSGYLPFENKENKEVTEENVSVTPSPPTPPASIVPGFMRAVSPEDEGVHYNKILVSREWWYWSAILDGKDSGLKGWSVAVSFNHMAIGDLFGTLKPDLLVVTLHGPNGEEYGGMINKKRGFGIFSPPTLEAKSPGVSVTYDNSWAEGKAPKWHVHAESGDIDKNHKIIIDLDYFAPSEPIWTAGERTLDKSKSNIASYVFLGCTVNGTIKIDETSYKVKGNGFHEHSWSPGIVTRGLINGWDWCHMSLDNGWNIYFTSYYPTPQALSRKTSRINPFGTLVITTDNGKTLTILDNVDPKIVASDTKVFPFVKVPSEISITAKPSLLQIPLTTNKIQLNIDIKADNTYEKVWKFPTYVGMKVGRSIISGKITWTDDDGKYEVDLNGLGTVWSMSALF